MSDSRRRRDAKAARRNARRKARHPESPDDQPLLGEVRRALADPDPMSMLMCASTLMSITDPRGHQPFASPRDPAPAGLPELATTFIEVPAPETSALLAVFAVMAADDEMLSARIRRELAMRPPPEPAWLGELSAVEAYRGVVMSHILGDGDNIILGVRLPGGHEASAVVYVDHNLGTLVKDAFFISESIETVVAKYQDIADDPDTRWDEIPLADARTRIADAIHLAALTVPPFETESWPASRALLEWLIRGLPDGGAHHPRPQWDPAAVTGLVERFFGSDDGRHLDDGDHRSLLEIILRYATDYGSGDPLHWSTVKVELLLADWLPRKVIGTVQYLGSAPNLLRAFIRFVHREAGVRPDLTLETLAAVDAWEPEFRGMIAEHDLSPDDDGLGSMMLDFLARDVGGEAELACLNDAPLPDEPFEWDGIPDDVTERVAEVLQLTDRCCGDILDVEYRTACRRLLARAATGDPKVFRRNASTKIAAAAIVWAIGKGNDLFGRGMRASDLMRYFDVQGSASQRAATLLRAAGIRGDAYDMHLGSPDYLTSARRRRIIELRERYRDFDESF